MISNCIKVFLFSIEKAWKMDLENVWEPCSIVYM